MTDYKRLVKKVVADKMHWVGDGLPVYQAIGTQDLGRYLNPFILLDYGAPYTFKPHPYPRGVGKHPHRGFETVTIAFQGEITHSDSTGESDTIHTGDIQWMTAGSGIEHSEKHSDKFSKEGGVLEMMQLWVNLPAKFKMQRPKYQAITKKDIPTVELVSKNGTADVIAGEYYGTKGPATTFTPINILSIKLNGETTLKVPEGWIAAVLVRRGSIVVGLNQQVDERGLAAFSRNGQDILMSGTNAEVVVIAGEPLDEKYVAYGPMVMNTEDEVIQAFEDYKSGLFK